MITPQNEKERRGSNLIQLRISDKMREQLEERADFVGLTLTSYIYHILAKTIEKKQK